MKSLFKINADIAGFFTSMLCAIHCSAIPVFISLGLLSSSHWLHDHMVDWIVIGSGILIAGYSLVGDYIRGHRELKPLIIASIGFGFLFLGMIEHHGWMLMFSVLGGLMVAWAHILNMSLGRVCSVKKVI